jgi:peptide subunit release factor 1 (eRF1)
MTFADSCSSVRASPDLTGAAQLSSIVPDARFSQEDRMISREELRQLAQIESSEASAISFYFQPQTPQDKSHREEAILVKDLVREAMRTAERNGSHQALREDLKRVLEIAEGLHGNHSRGKAILACRDKGIWRELDVPPHLGISQLKVNSRFHLAPLVAAFACAPSAVIAITDRQKARIFELQNETISEKLEIEFGRLHNSGKSDGFMGYDAGHRERHKENEVMNHFKQFVESLQLLMGKARFDSFLIGCRDETWPEVEPHLRTELKQKLAGRFVADPGGATAESVRSVAEQIIANKRALRQRDLVREVIGQSSRNSTGAVGLRHVLTALERQEVQTLVISRDLHAEAVECTNCRHLDTRMVKNCAVCGQETRHLNEISDALIDFALRNGADIQILQGDAELEKAGRVGALLRYRADQNTVQKAAV